VINSMDSSPCEAFSRSGTREFSISWRLKFYYRIHNSPTLVLILSQKSPVHTTPNYFSNICLNITLPPTSRFSLGLFYQNLYALLFSCKSTSYEAPLEDHPLSASRDYLVNTFADILGISIASENAPCRGEKGPK
jgi:hypothetical protein